MRALECVSSEGSGPWDDEQSTRFLSEFCMGMGDNEDTNYAAQRYADQQLTSTTLEVESTKNRGQYLNQIFATLKKKKEIKTKPKDKLAFLKRKMSLRPDK